MLLIKRKIVLALFILGLKLLDRDFKPLENSEDALTTILVLAVIFFGDIVWSWITRR
jgi:hypothetical protein